MRDLDKIREKTTLSLDTQHVFGLFAGGAVALSLVFASGVAVGKKIQAPVSMADLEGDPLRMLDDLTLPEQLTYQNGLMKDAPMPMPPAKPGKVEIVDVPVVEELADEPPAKPEPEASATAPVAPAAAAPAPAKAVAAPVQIKGPFTLQLSSFQEKVEADEFARTLSEKGYLPYVVTADVPGKGLFYRVRFGDFSRRDDALAAKEKFERTQHVIAYVAKL